MNSRINGLKSIIGTASLCRKTPYIFGFIVGLAAILTAHTIRANDADDESDRNGAVRVDVVVDMTLAGKKVAHPTPDKPAFYLPLSVGYKEFGYAHHFQRPPPNAWDVEHALAIALYEQGYRLMTKQGHPSLVLVFWWGYMAPEDIDMDNPSGPVDRPGSLAAQPGTFYWGGGQGPGGFVPGLSDNFIGNGASGIFPGFSLMTLSANELLMSSMVAGKTINDHEKWPDPRLEAVEQLTTQARYYVLISAFDFNSWLHHRTKLLWRAHVSTEQWGHYFDQVVGTLISTAAPEFGRETKVPHFINAPLVPLGRVIVGTPVVTDYLVKPARTGKKP